MRSLCRWLTIVIVLALASGCCTKCSNRLQASQTPVAVAGDQPVKVRPLKGGKVQRVQVPDGYLIAEPPPQEWEPSRKTEAVR